MSKNLIDLLNIQPSLMTSQGNFVSFFDPTEASFWCSESGNEMICNRQWVQEWELFQIIKDAYSGDTMLQSNQTRKYAALQSNNTLKCNENRSVRETHLKIDENNGSFMASNNKFITVDKSSKHLMATSAIPVTYEIFDVRTVAISDPETSNYAHPDSRNGGMIAMGSSTPYTFYLLYNRMTKETYLETGSYEFLIPNNTVNPVTYRPTAIDVNNYRLKVECLDEKEGIYTILAEATNRYFSRTATSEYGDVIYADAENADGLAQKFRITPTR